MCNLLIIIVLATGDTITTKVEGLTCPADGDGYHVEHWWPAPESVTTVSTVVERAGDAG